MISAAAREIVLMLNQDPTRSYSQHLAAITTSSNHLWPVSDAVRRTMDVGLPFDRLSRDRYSIERSRLIRLRCLTGTSFDTYPDYILD